MNSQLKLKKVLGTKDIFAISFGAMIGWSWVINTGNWISNAGFIGTMIAFFIGGIMIIFVGLVYAELTAAMPKCGGEHVFSYRAFGLTGSFICTWGIILGYVATAAFEAAALPAAIKYIIGNKFDMGLLYFIDGVPIYATHIVVGVIAAIVIIYIHIRGIKTAAIMQKVFALVIVCVGLLLILSAVVRGDVNNLISNLFGGSANNGNQTAIGGILTVTCMTPFLFVGFDVIPQTAGEINISSKKLGKVIVFSIVMALLFYIMIVCAVSYIFSIDEIRSSINTGIPTADAMAKAFSNKTMGNVMIIGGLCGIITSWNSFFLGGTRAVYAMSEGYMLPRIFSCLHKKYKTPVYAILLCGIICIAAPFLGRAVLIWLMDAAGLGCSLAYFLVSISFLILRKREPEMERPYKIKHEYLTGVIALIMSGILVLLYIVPLPFSESALVWQEWVIVGGWTGMGIGFWFYSKKEYNLKSKIYMDIKLKEDKED